MQLGDTVEVIYDGGIGLTLVGERGVIVGPGEEGYDFTVRFTYPSGVFTMWFDTEELRLIEEG
jgi:hypothetical protein